MTLSLSDQKQAQRETAFKTRKSVTPDDAGTRAADNFLEHFDIRTGVVISLYSPIGTELDSMPLLHTLHERGVRCALPVIEGNGRPLVFRMWEPDCILEMGPFKALVPAVTAAVLVPDIVITPMLAFDTAGYRLGYGGGFYDRTLQKLRHEKDCRAVGYAYSAQEVDKVVTDAFDQRLDAVVTEKDVRKIK